MNDEVQHPISKVVAAVSLTVAGHSIAEWQQFMGLLSTCLACMVSAAFLAEWMWKHIVRPIGRRQGWLKHPDFVNSTIRGDL